jgi:hypothetical protein
MKKVRYFYRAFFVFDDFLFVNDNKKEAKNVAAAQGFEWDSAFL